MWYKKYGINLATQRQSKGTFTALPTLNFRNIESSNILASDDPLSLYDTLERFILGQNITFFMLKNAKNRENLSLKCYNCK